MCDFVDAKWPQKFQKVASSIWEVVGKFKKQADEAQSDLLTAIQLRNDAQIEKEALLVEKGAWTREKEHLINEKERLERDWP
jgi:Sec-independent protein translocase protein TatA